MAAAGADLGAPPCAAVSEGAEADAAGFACGSALADADLAAAVAA